jgi:NADPH:quinone reductase-like Zn-dependent oxidoreductase
MIAMAFCDYGTPDVLRPVVRPVPVPGEGEVRVDIRAVAALPVDCKIRSGALKAFFDVPLPKIPGRDGAGIVGAVGPGVDNIKVGDRICVVAGHAEQGTYQQALIRSRDTIVQMPEGMGFADAAALIHAGVCVVICLLDTAQIQPDMRVLIHGGSGAIGPLAIQLAKSRGAFVATTCRALNKAFVLDIGADIAVAYDQEDFTDISDPFDIVLDLVGGEVNARSYNVLRKGGHLVCLNAAPITDLSEQFGVRMTVARIHETPEILSRVMALAGQGVLRPRVAMTLPLAQASEAHRRMEQGGAGPGRIILEIPPL